MNFCKKCGQQIPTRIEINGVKKLVCGRKFCLNCSPWGTNNRKDLTITDKIRDDKRKKQENERSKRYYKRHSETQKNKREENKRKVIAMFGGKCQICGYNKCIAALCFHHRNPEEKKFTLSGVGWTISFERIINEAKKCDLLCSNCHNELHNGNNIKF